MHEPRLSPVLAESSKHVVQPEGFETREFKGCSTSMESRSGNHYFYGHGGASSTMVGLSNAKTLFSTLLTNGGKAYTSR